MEALFNLSTKLQQLTDEQLFQLIMSNDRSRAMVVQLLKERQLEQGIDGQGNTLPLYVTNDKGMFGEPYNLKDTGAFYESIFAQLNGDELEIVGDTLKPTVDLAVYGDIMNLNESTLQEFIDLGLPILRQELLEYLLSP